METKRKLKIPGDEGRLGWGVRGTGPGAWGPPMGILYSLFFLLNTKYTILFLLGVFLEQMASCF